MTLQSQIRLFNVEIAKAIGLHETLVLMELTYKDNGLDFYATYTDLSSNTCLSEYQVRKAVKRLIELNIINVEMKGLPAKQYYSINNFNICNTSYSEIKGLDPLKIKGLSSPKESEAILTKKSRITKASNKIKEKKTLINIDAETFEEPQRTYVIIAKTFQQVIINNLKELDISYVSVEKAPLSWADEVRKLIEIDGYEKEDFRKVIRVLQKDDFWKPIVLSVASLRNKNKSGQMKFQSILSSHTRIQEEINYNFNTEDYGKY